MKVAEEWEEQGSAWAPVQWSHCFDTALHQSKESKVLSVCQAIEIIVERKLSKERIKNGKVLTSVSTAKNYRDLLTTLNQFTKQKYNRALSTYYFNEITEEFVNDYVFFLQKRGLENGNNAGLESRLRRFYGLLYYADKMNIPNIDMSIFEQVRAKMRPKEFAPKTLPREVITQIENVDRTLFTRLEIFYIDLFLFSFYTGGMANIDVAYLTWDCVDDDGRLEFRQRLAAIQYPSKT